MTTVIAIMFAAAVAAPTTAGREAAREAARLAREAAWALLPPLTGEQIRLRAEADAEAAAEAAAWAANIKAQALMLAAHPAIGVKGDLDRLARWVVASRAVEVPEHPHAAFLAAVAANAAVLREGGKAAEAAKALASAFFEDGALRSILVLGDEQGHHGAQCAAAAIFGEAVGLSKEATGLLFTAVAQRHPYSPDWAWGR